MVDHDARVDVSGGGAEGGLVAGALRLGANAETVDGVGGRNRALAIREADDQGAVGLGDWRHQGAELVFMPAMGRHQPGFVDDDKGARGEELAEPHGVALGNAALLHAR
ncbi:MAG: hypothetical protein R3C16_08155 [Hyphomonadaceae bacterium]